MQSNLEKEQQTNNYPFKIGLEIHQQLLTEKKLFCSCMAGNYNPRIDSEILRHMRPTLSDSTEFDKASLMEFKSRKEIIYQLNGDSVCTYDIDDAPPFQLNPDALQKTIKIAALFNFRFIDETFVVRKQYLDGSIPAGFQRSCLIGLNGSITIHGKELKLNHILLEEDSCRKVLDKAHTRVFKTDRFGIPLVEIVTPPLFSSAEEIVSIAKYLDLLLKNSGYVRSGCGTRRFDLNISVLDGKRVEIKGISSIKSFLKAISKEKERQISLLSVKTVLKERQLSNKNFSPKIKNITKILKNCEYGPIKYALKKNQIIKAINLPGFGKLLNYKLNKNTTFSKEFSDRIKTIACLDQKPNMINSDEDLLSISSLEWDKILTSFSDPYLDVVVITWGNEAEVDVACQEIIERACETFDGVPSESRALLSDGTTNFIRLLNDKPRITPDSDLPPIKIEADLSTTFEKTAFIDKLHFIENHGIETDKAIKIALSPLFPALKKIIEKCGEGRIIFSTFQNNIVSVIKKSRFPERVTPEIIEQLYSFYLEKKVTFSGLLRLTELFLNDEVEPVLNDKLLLNMNLNPISEKHLLEHIETLFLNEDFPVIEDYEKLIRYYMRIFFDDLKYKIEGKRAKELLESYLKKKKWTRI